MDDNTTNTQEKEDLIVVGSSAGGVEALTILVSTLPEDFPAPIVLAQHLDPNRPSNLDAILQRHTSLTVEVVNSNNKLQAGKIYVVPSNRHITIKDGYVTLPVDTIRHPRPSVDLLLSSAAESYGEHLIGVILTGSGSDGAAGAVDVKNAGGTVIIQNPQTARYPSMPLSLPPTVVDFEANIEQMGQLLYNLLTGVVQPRIEDGTDNSFHVILDYVNRQASIDFRQYKTSTILRRIGRRMTITRCPTIQDYKLYLEKNPAEIGELINAILINVTQFFRDPEAFAYLQQEILPIIVNRARERDRVLRFWTAGCATGEEAYSLAIMLSNYLGAEISEWSIKIFATDLDEAAITFARRGIYSESLLKSLPLEYRSRYFEHLENGYRISKAIRQLVIFGQQDLTRSAPFPHIDLILCRNVLIYFTPELQEYLLGRFAFSLYHYGFLFLGKAETVRPLQVNYELVSKQWKVYRRTNHSIPILTRPAQTIANDWLTHENKLPMRSQTKLTAEIDAHTPSSDLAQIRHINELLFRFLPIGIVVINRNYLVLTANTAARRLLGIYEMHNEQDFLHSVNGIPYSSVRSAIDTAFREQKTITLPEVELENNVGGNGHFLSLSFSPIQFEVGKTDLIAISISEVTEELQTRRQLEMVQSQQIQLLKELSTTNQRLNDLNKELQDANEELQVSNEELVLTHEELQATIEEFETTNEELQATNEELETNNEELQATNEELETTNDELRASTIELQEITGKLENERVRLAEMVELAPFYIMILRGPELIVEAYNPRYARLLEGRSANGHPLKDVFELSWEYREPIIRLAQDTYRQDTVSISSRMPMLIPNTNGERTERYFVYTMVPTHDSNNKVSGVVIYAEDETEQRTREAEDELEKLRMIFDNTTGIKLALYDAQTTKLLIASPRYFETFQQVLDGNQISIGRKWSELPHFMPADEAKKHWDTVQSTKSPLRLSEIHWQPDPNEPATIWDWVLTPILSSDTQNSIRFMLVSAVEMTEQTLARQKIEQLNELKDEFFSLASHELRTPLTSIQGNTQLLLLNLQRLALGTGVTAGKKAEKNQIVGIDPMITIIDRVLHQINRMTKLIDEMLDITRIQGGVFEITPSEHVNLIDIAQRAIEEQGAISNRTINLETSLEALSVTCDETRIEQVLNNLINNAIKYSPSDKPITVMVTQNTETNEVVVSVKDEGNGISEEQQVNLFDRFYRTASSKRDGVEGLGLGLYICNKIIVQHGGRIWLKSQPGEGSTFYFSLPDKH